MRSPHDGSLLVTGTGESASLHVVAAVVRDRDIRTYESPPITVMAKNTRKSVAKMASHGVRLGGMGGGK